jgi:metal-sulfur cluster biosynthetic enzyme
MIDGARVRSILDEIIDPCSVNAGIPAGISKMGLVHAVRITSSASDGANVDVTIGVTEPGCMMAAPFAAQAYDRLLSEPGIDDVTIRIDTSTVWTDEDMQANFRTRLHAHRLLGQATQQSGRS